MYIVFKIRLEIAKTPGGNLFDARLLNETLTYGMIFSVKTYMSFKHYLQK